MMQNWSADHIRFMEDAAAYGTFYPELTDILLPYLPHDGHLCDVGCGLGHLSLALSPHIRQITACDLAQVPTAWLNARAPQNVVVRQCDIFATPPAVPYDAMVMCIFGHTQDVLSLAKAQCKGPVAVIQRADKAHYFSGKATSYAAHTSALEELLNEHSTPYTKRSFSLEFGQPLRSREDALRFFRLYGTEDSILAERLASMQPVSHPEFTYYLPIMRHFNLLVFDSRDL